MHLHALQADLRGIELFRPFHLHRAQQLAAEVVGPAVVAAHQALCLAATVGNRSGAMPADVEKAMDRAAVVGEQQRLVAEPGREVIAGIRQLADMTDDLPRACEDALALGLQAGGIDVELGRRRFHPPQFSKRQRSVMKCRHCGCKALDCARFPHDFLHDRGISLCGP